LSIKGGDSLIQAFELVYVGREFLRTHARPEIRGALHSEREGNVLVQLRSRVGEMVIGEESLELVERIERTRSEKILDLFTDGRIRRRIQVSAEARGVVGSEDGEKRLVPIELALRLGRLLPNLLANNERGCQKSGDQ